MIHRPRYGYTDKLMDGICPLCENSYTVVYWMYWLNPWWRCGVCLKAVARVTKH